ncbi:MAG: hypothetical protein JKY26_01575 [Pseudomonas sp.]|nr:hypothetical protein [Pseudomonas sp.]
MPSIKLQATFEEGKNAALCHKTLDDCPYRRAEKINAWVRGFHEGKLRAEQLALSPVQARTNQGHIAHLRSLFTTQH